MAKFYMMAKYTPEALKGFMSKPSDDRKAASAKSVSYTHLRAHET